MPTPRKKKSSPRRTHEQAGSSSASSSLRNEAVALIDSTLARSAPPDLRALLRSCLQHVDDEAAAFRKKLNHDIQAAERQKREQVVNVKATHTGDRQRRTEEEAARPAAKSKAHDDDTRILQSPPETNKKKEVDPWEVDAAKKPAGKLDAEASAKQRAEEVAVHEAAAAAKAAAEAQRKAEAAEMQKAAEAKKIAEEHAAQAAAAAAAASERAAAEAQSKAEEAALQAKLENEAREAAAAKAAEEAKKAAAAKAAEEALRKAELDPKRKLDADTKKEAERTQRKPASAEDKAVREAERLADEARLRATQALDEALAAEAKVDQATSASLKAAGSKASDRNGQTASRESIYRRKARSWLGGVDGDRDHDEDSDETNVRESRGGGGVFTITYGNDRTYGRGSTAADAMEEEEFQLQNEAAEDMDEGVDDALGDGELPSWLRPWHQWGGARSAEMDGALTVQADCLAFDGKDTLICIGGDGDARSVSLYSIKLGHATASLQGHTDKVVSVACQGDLIASGSKDTTIRLWSRRTGTRTATLIGCEAAVHGLALQGSLLLSGEGGVSKDGWAKVRLWSVSTGKCTSIFSEHQGAVWSVALEDGIGVSASHDTTARVWPTDGTSENSLGVLKHPNWVCSVSVDGDLAATGCADKRIRLWSLMSYSCSHILEHGGASAITPVFSVRLVRGGEILLSGGNDHNVKVWHLRGGSRAAEGVEDGAAGSNGNSLADIESITTLSHEENVRGLAVLPQLKCIVSAGGRSASSVVVWKPAPRPDTIQAKRGRTPGGWLFSK